MLRCIFFCVLYRTPYNFKDRPLCPYCLYSPHIFRNVRRWFWRYIPTGRTHLRRAPWKISSNFCSVIRIRLSYCGTVSAMKLSHAEQAAGELNPHIFNAENTDNRNSAFSRRIPAYWTNNIFTGKTNKSEPIANRHKVRIYSFWWSQRGSSRTWTLPL